jgi:TonB family protein
VAASDILPLCGHPIVEASIMFGTLLESRARRRGRPGGAAVSVAMHVAIFGAVTATTVHSRVVKPVKPEPLAIRLDHPPAPRPATRTTTDAGASAPITISAVVIRHIVAPTTISPTLPPIDQSFGQASDSIDIGHAGSGLVRALLDNATATDAREWRGVDLQTRILASGTPRYPESLRQAAIDGVVLVRFVVDTAGRIDMSSVAIVSSTHDLFSRSVRDALPSFRFKPAESGGHRVSALAEMPFEFRIAK